MTIVMADSLKEEKIATSCIACKKGVLVKRTYIEYIPRINHGSPSPASDHIGTDSDRVIAGYHCDYCGIEYHKLPNKKEQPKVVEVLYFVEDIRKIRFRSKFTSARRE